MSESDHENLSNESSDDNASINTTTNKIYNKQALLQKLKEIKHENISFIQLPVINSGFIHQNINVEDDFEREVSFYKQTIAGCQEARLRLENANVKYKRPDDYFAEMLKSDSHMAKVRQNLLDQQKRIEAVEERRRQRELKRFGKQVQIEKEQTRVKQKKSEIEAIKKWRKDQKRNTSTSGDGNEQKDIDSILEDAKKDSIKPKPKKNLKRKRKDALYGFGGKQKRSKVNTKESASDLASFNFYKNKSVDKDLHPLIPKFAASRGPKRRTGKPPKKLRKISH